MTLPVSSFLTSPHNFCETLDSFLRPALALPPPPPQHPATPPNFAAAPFLADSSAERRRRRLKQRSTIPRLRLSSYDAVTKFDVNAASKAQASPSVVPRAAAASSSQAATERCAPRPAKCCMLMRNASPLPPVEAATGRYWGVQSNGNYMANTQTYTRIWDTSAAGFQWWLPSLNGVSVPAASKTSVNKDNAFDPSPDVFQAENFFCGDLNAIYDIHAAVGMNVNQYFAPSILRNPHYREKLKDIFGDDPFGPVSRFLLTPSAGTSKLADNFRRSHLDDKFVVGMHIRVSGGWGLLGDADEWMELFAKAARAANTKETNPKQRQVV
jgi:hypothetical protein